MNCPESDEEPIILKNNCHTITNRLFKILLHMTYFQ